MTGLVAAVEVTVVVGLLSVILGAVLGGLIEFVLERRRETARARAGARLIRHDLAHADGHLREAYHGESWRDFWIARVEHWKDYRDLLATHLDAGAWNCVARAVDTLRHIEVEVRADRRSEGAREWPVSANLRRRMADGCMEALTAYNALAKLAQEEKVDALPHSALDIAVADHDPRAEDA